MPGISAARDDFRRVTPVTEVTNMEESRLSVRLPAELRAALEQAAERNCRSINGHVVYTLREAVRRDREQRQAEAAR
ncbi:Arc family DNA-binding protein [Bradyrhizobium jicamae]|uniref:Arc family DNA-binding protein n=1 Tax=Bradyrhizobium jicamae TaxID=280332 RepID=UPI001BAC0CDA|nr:Arc family DNA-binding protein [Bradyrhizobium jicamae]MBR0937420.1 Arc family DNA-binding protein [Bradyrhizobium jicamae]